MFMRILIAPSWRHFAKRDLIRESFRQARVGRRPYHACMSMYVGYDRAWEIVCGFESRLRAFRPQAVAGIFRGGIFPAAMAAHLLSLPLYAVDCPRGGRARWHSAFPPPPCRIVLADEIAATGRTMAEACGFLRGLGYDVLTLALFHDPASRFIPDLSIPAPAYIQFPWEFRDRSPGTLAARMNGRVSHDSEKDFFGVDLDGVIAPDIRRRQYRRAVRSGEIARLVAARSKLAMNPQTSLPPVDWRRTVIVTGRPECDLAATRAWLAERGLGAVPVYARPDGIPPEASAAHKARTIADLGITHFYESDLLQALEISRLAPATAVYWWGRNPDRRFRVFAASAIGGKS